MINDLPDPGPMEEKKILAKMARVTCMTGMAPWSADFADPSFLTVSKHSRRSITGAKRREKEKNERRKKIPKIEKP